MKHRTHFAARTALALAAVAALGGWPTESSALGLGRLSVQSALGETMRAEIDITNLTPEEAASLSVRVAPPEAYRSAGVEYNNVLSAAQVTVARRPDGRPYLLVSSARAVQEPFLEVILEMNWASGRLVREYTLLFDPPGSRMAPPAQAAAPTAPVIAAAPVAPPRVVAAPLPRAEPVVRTPPPPAVRPAPAPAPRIVARAPAPPPVAARPEPRRAPVARPAPPTGDYTVRRGDTLSEIALSRRYGGVSLDQMLVGLYRANPDAFISGNMNRLMAGAVLTMPEADSVRSVSRAEARRVIVAQSRDFDAYRARLAGRVPRNTAEDDTNQRAKGTVQAAVEDRKQDASASPDRLKLSAGGVKASEAAARVAAENERKAAADRAAELKRNVDDLKKLQGGSAPSPAAESATSAVVAAAAAAAAAGSAADAAAQSVADGVKSAADQVADAASESMAAVVPPVMSTPAASVPPPVVPEPTPAPAPVPAPTAQAAPSADEPGFLDGLINSPWLLPGAGILAVLLAGFGAWRLRSRMQKSPSETSFLESRMQPDSFFGASGGQRVDTQDAGASAASSMGYSLSQIDAIGDVDPVAEADVYLAYGRDLQAEEILKEAMRSSPDRLAVRTKLLEVYAKRRDTKGFEMLAAQLFALTKGDGSEWERAQEMGLQIDPDNPMYQPGGRPAEVTMDGDRVVPEPLSATTLPHQMTQMPPVAQDSQPSDLDLDLDLDLSDESPTGGRGLEATQPMPGQGMTDLAASAAATTAQNSSPGTFDPLSLDLSPPSESPASSLGAATRKAAEPFPRTSQGSLEGPTSPGELDGLPDDGDPLARKLELAEEFRQIGDVEGARDLINEVLDKADGVLKAKAQSMLDALS